MTPTPEDITELIRLQVGKMSYIKSYENSLRLGYLRQLAVRTIELIDAMPEKDRTNTTGVYDNG